MGVPYRNIKKAFEQYYVISGVGPQMLADNQAINRSLAHATSWQLTKLNNALHFNLIPHANHTAARLVDKFLQVLADGFDNYMSCSSYSSSALQTARRGYINTIKNKAIPITGGAFFYNSFLGYAKPKETKVVKMAWSTCLEQLDWGIRVVSFSNSSTACANLFRRYFGDPAVNRADVLLKLKNVRTHMQSAGTYFVNRGNSAVSINYHEPTGNGNGFAPVSPSVGGDVAWAASDHSRHLVGLTQSFFADGVAMRTKSHKWTSESKPLGFTFGGAILHELTHNVLNTVDVKLPEEAFKIMKKDFVAETKSYGTNACIALAKVDPALAKNNADSYRIFCEDALYRKPL